MTTETSRISNVQVSGGDHDTVSVNGVADRQPDVPSCDAYYGLQLSCAVRLTDTPNNAPDFRFALGRQRIVLSDQRFVGNVGWRQHEQTFDGISLVNASLPATTLTYGAMARGLCPAVGAMALEHCQRDEAGRGRISPGRIPIAYVNPCLAEARL